MVNLLPRRKMINVFLKLPGCTNTTVNITSLTQPGVLIYICYGVGDSPYGPFTYKGIVLNPVKGRTNHHSIVKVDGKWYLFYHDVQLSGQTHLRNIKVAELTHNPDGTIQTINPFLEEPTN